MIVALDADVVVLDALADDVRVVGRITSTEACDVANFVVEVLIAIGHHGVGAMKESMRIYARIQSHIRTWRGSLTSPSPRPNPDHRCRCQCQYELACSVAPRRHCVLLGEEAPGAAAEVEEGEAEWAEAEVEQQRR